MAKTFNPVDAYNYMIQEKGYPQHVALAIMDNFMGESGLNPGINEIAPLVPGSRGGRGLYQLTGPRRTQFEQLYGTDYDWKDQIDFMDWEFKNTEKRAAERIFGTDNRRDAVAAITRDFLRPAVDNSAHRFGLWNPEDVTEIAIASVNPKMAMAADGLSPSPKSATRSTGSSGRISTRGSTRRNKGIGDDDDDNDFGPGKLGQMRAGLADRFGLDRDQMAGLGGALRQIGLGMVR